MRIERIKELIELRRSLLDLRNAWFRVNKSLASTMYSVYIEDYISTSYPFENSFDEMLTVDWIELTIANIEEDIFNFDVIVINEGQIIYKKIKMYEYANTRELFDDYVDILNRCENIALGETTIIRHEELSSGEWLIVKWDN